MKTSKLSGAALDWAVAKCEGVTCAIWQGVVVDEFSNPLMYHDDWAQGGAIIEREGINLDNYAKNPQWSAWTPAPERATGEAQAYGRTPLIAAMRCYVASKMGDEVQLPEELT